jgi:hypothetical protein
LDLMILIGTLGGVSVFGAVGFIVGPVVAALFVALWDVYGRASPDLLSPDRSAVEKIPRIAESVRLSRVLQGWTRCVARWLSPHGRGILAEDRPFFGSRVVRCLSKQRFTYTDSDGRPLRARL